MLLSRKPAYMKTMMKQNNANSMASVPTVISRGKKRNCKSARRLTKQCIRSKMLLRLKSHKEEARKRKNQSIKTKLFRTSVFRKAKTVMFYISFGGEVDTSNMIETAKKLGKTIVVPVCKHNKITLRPCILMHKAKLEKGPYGICQPADKNFIKAEDLDLVIVPGLAFDKKGNRLGRGRGCYDYFLKRLFNRVPTVGLAYDFQILPSIPTTKTDISVRRVIFS